MEPHKRKKSRQLKATDVLKDHFRALHPRPGSDHPTFTQEFHELEERCMLEDYDLPCSCAELEVNLGKNRYTNVLAPDETRVKLSLVDGKPNSDYINANWIETVCIDLFYEVLLNKYISTQGPLPETVPDFWRMIREHGVFVIVMLTREIENGIIKCYQYWPDAEEKYGQITVQLVEKKEDGAHIIQRIFYVQHEDDATGRYISMFQCTVWPDHGLPDSPETFISLIEKVDAVNSPPNAGPIVVHCSAGIGRSGTFCCVHTIARVLRDKADDGITADEKATYKNIVFDTILRLRKQRPGMVQTREQYYFCYLAILALTVPKFRRALQKKVQQIEAKRRKDNNTNQDQHTAGEEIVEQEEGDVDEY